jgi:hypothetical protein
MTKNVYFIGNGFDLHHFIRSSYKNYADWLKSYDYSLYLKVNIVYGVVGREDNWWGDFENQMGELNVEVYSAWIYRNYGPDFGSDSFREADRFVAEMKAEQELNDLFHGIKTSFYKWIQQLNLANVLRKVELDISDSYFICFNYTDTLRRLYKIPQDKICYIHGNARNGDELILGHGKTKDQLIEPTKMPPNLSKDQQQEWIDEYMTDDSYHRTVDASIDAVSNQRKEVEKIINKNVVVWNQMTQAQNFYIYGLSFSKIDTPYITKAISMMDKKKVVIHVSYYGQEDKDNIYQYFKQIKYPVEMINLVNLEDIMIYA